MTWIVTLRGRRGAYGTGLALVARLVSHGAVTPRPFAWQAWHFVTSAFTCLHFAWQAWHLMTWIVTLRGRRGTYGTGLALVVRLVSQLRDIYRRFVWQAWHWTISIVTLRGMRGTYGTGLALVARLVSHGAGVLRGRRGTS